MFKKSPKTKQFNLFCSPSGLMCERESRMYDDESAWHNKFYKEVTSKVDEDIFKPLYTTEREDNRVGRPNAASSRCINNSFANWLPELVNTEDCIKAFQGICLIQI